MVGTKMAEVKTVRIRHKIIAKQGLESPIKFQILPKVSVLFDEEGVAEVPVAIGLGCVKSNPEIYELVEAPVAVAPPLEQAPALKSKKMPPKVEEAKIENVPEEPEKTEFIKQII